MAFRRFGIGARLFIAFVVITAVSLSSGVASWFVLREISGAQSRLIAEALPAVSATQRTLEPKSDHFLQLLRSIRKGRTRQFTRK